MFPSIIISWSVRCRFQKESNIYCHDASFAGRLCPHSLKTCLTLLSQTINQNYPEILLAREEESFGDRAFNKEIG